MKIHLLPDEGMDIRRVRRIHALLEETDGLIDFRLQKPVPVRTVAEAAEFEELYEVCSCARGALRIPSNEYLVLLTDRPNRMNHFAGMDISEPRNGYVHAGEWNLYLACEDALPVAFTVLNLVLLHKSEPDQTLLTAVLHQKPIGCVNDFCGYKADVIFKLRTGDICEACIERMRRHGLSDMYLEHAIRILGHLSGQMKHHFAFKPKLELSSVVIDMCEGTVTLPDYEDRMVQIPPISLAYYVLLLLHVDGILNDAWQQDPIVKGVWLAAYRVLKPMQSERELAASITAHCASEQERNSRTGEVKKAFEACLGPKIASDYVVKVKRSVCRLVTLPRERVTIRNFNSLDAVISGDEVLESAWRMMKSNA
ncbi:MAG: hypothetical protein EBZ67_00960 [Chitinophagia bacterium]|nr:hypothetical protein [Chitinophagia bacterium]